MRLEIKGWEGKKIGGEIGDGEDEELKEGILRVSIRLGIERIVMVIGVGRIDGDERDLEKVLEELKSGREWGLRIEKKLVRKKMRDLMLVNGDNRKRILNIDGEKKMKEIEERKEVKERGKKL